MGWHLSGQDPDQIKARTADSNHEHRPIWLEKDLFDRRILLWLVIGQFVVTLLFGILLPGSYRSSLIEHSRVVIETTLKTPVNGTEGASGGTGPAPGGGAFPEDPTTYTFLFVLPALVTLFILVVLYDGIQEKAEQLPELLCQNGRLKPVEGMAFRPFLLQYLYHWGWIKSLIVIGMVVVLIALPALSGYYQEAFRVLRNERNYLQYLEYFDLQSQLSDVNLALSKQTQGGLQEQIDQLKVSQNFYLAELERVYGELGVPQDSEKKLSLQRSQESLNQRLKGTEQNLTHLARLQERASAYLKGISTSNTWLRLTYLLWIVYTTMLMPLITGIITGLGLYYIYALKKSFEPMVPKYFSLDVDPSHRDRAGGLARLGNLYLEMIGLFAIPLVFLGLLVRFRSLFDWGPLFDIIVVVGFGLLIFPMIWISDLIMDVSNEMRKKRREYYDELARREEEIKKRLYALIKKKAHLEGPVKSPNDSQPQAPVKTVTFWQWLVRLLGLQKAPPPPTPAPDVDEEIKRYQETLDAIQKLYPADKNFPVLPFDLSFLAAITVSQVASILWVLFGLQSNQYFKDILSLLFSGGG